MRSKFVYKELYFLNKYLLIIVCLRDIFEGNSSVNHRKVQESVNYSIIEYKNVWMMVNGYKMPIFASELLIMCICTFVD